MDISILINWLTLHLNIASVLVSVYIILECSYIMLTLHNYKSDDNTIMQLVNRIRYVLRLTFGLSVFHIVIQVKWILYYQHCIPSIDDMLQSVYDISILLWLTWVATYRYRKEIKPRLKLIHK